jgi:hypothetical protein
VHRTAVEIKRQEVKADQADDDQRWKAEVEGVKIMIDGQLDVVYIVLKIKMGLSLINQSAESKESNEG